MRRIAALVVVAGLMFPPAWAQEQRAALPDAGAAAEDTILGMTYDKAAVVAVAVVAGAVALNTLVGANIGTILAVLYVGHIAVEVALVAGGAGATWGLGWWGDTAEPPPAN